MFAGYTTPIVELQLFPGVLVGVHPSGQPTVALPPLADSGTDCVGPAVAGSASPMACCETKPHGAEHRPGSPPFNAALRSTSKVAVGGEVGSIRHTFPQPFGATNPWSMFSGVVDVTTNECPVMSNCKYSGTSVVLNGQFPVIEANV